ncbi:MAG TPA: basic secretory protein-like protein [Polyangiaceae bacterium]|nr:basic secretory protein-like protein [Polyangiaceae bacterium]
MFAGNQSMIGITRKSVTLGILASATACSGVASDAGPESALDSATDLGHAEAALTTQQRVLGFEAPLGWTASAGSIGTSTTHTEGATSLSLRNASYSELTSEALSTLSGVSAELAIDVRPPAAAGWGQLQIFASSATLGWSSYQWLGQASLVGLPAGQFTQVKVSLPATVQQKLAQSYGDLRIRLAVNAPASSSGWLFDNLHFVGSTPPPPDCSTGSQYTLTLVNEQGVDATHLQNLRCTFFQVYPLLVNRFNAAATRNVTFSFVETGNNPAWADPGTGVVFLNKAYLAGNPLDSDVVVHETMHIVQAGYSGQVEGWIIEGSADYARDRYGLTNAENHWSIPTGWSAGQHFANGYGEAAAFFKWVDARYRQNQAPVVDALDDIMRTGQYADSTWVSLTGKTVTALWQEYSNNQAPVPASSGVTLYRDSNFTGWSFVVGTGTYNATDLGSRGLHDVISSLRVPAGYRVIAYLDSESQGASTQFTGDASYVGDDWNDKISTIVVQRL